MMRGHTKHLATLTLIGAVLASCSGSTDATDDGTTTDDGASTGTTLVPDEPDTDDRPDIDTTLEAEQVVLAIVLLAAGDVDAAVAEGLVSPAEVDAASRAITAGTAQDWFDLAAEQLAAG